MIYFMIYITQTVFFFKQKSLMNKNCSVKTYAMNVQFSVFLRK